MTTFIVSTALVLSIFSNTLYTAMSTYELDTTVLQKNEISILFEIDTEEEIHSVISVLKSRLDFLGYRYANFVVKDKNRFSVDLPKTENLDEIIDFLSSSVQLKFIDENGKVLLSDNHVASASAIKDSTGYSVQLEFTNEGITLFSEATANNIGKSIYIMLDDEVLSAPIVNEHIVSDTVTITGNFTKEDAEILAQIIAIDYISFTLKAISIHDKIDQ